LLSFLKTNNYYDTEGEVCPETRALAIFSPFTTGFPPSRPFEGDSIEVGKAISQSFPPCRLPQSQVVAY
jgi:hypothetical protein